MPEYLEKIEFVQVCLKLEFLAPFRLSIENLLRLRRNLHQAVKEVIRRLPAAVDLDFDALFDPPLSSDPYARRRYQLPGPALVVQPPGDLPRVMEVGDSIDLPVLLFGRGIYLLEELGLAFQELGFLGFHLGEGFFKLTAIDALDAAGRRSRIWQGGTFAELPLTVINASWWLDGFADGSAIRLQFHTPARLLSNNRPLFRPRFAQLFRFVMRRVTSMVYAHCDIELIDDSEPLFAAAEGLREVDNRLYWQDWRTLEGDEHRQDLGGIVGSLLLEGPELVDILWLLRLASLLNLGKGAAFGAGHFSLHEVFD